MLIAGENRAGEQQVMFVYFCFTFVCGSRFAQVQNNKHLTDIDHLLTKDKILEALSHRMCQCVVNCWRFVLFAILSWIPFCRPEATHFLTTWLAVTNASRQKQNQLYIVSGNIQSCCRLFRHISFAFLTRIFSWLNPETLMSDYSHLIKQAIFVRLCCTTPCRMT